MFEGQSGLLGNNITSVILFLLSALVHGVYNLDYSDLQALAISCPRHDKCDGYGNNLTYTERSCECDSACDTYNDCCIDVMRRISSGIRNGPRNGMTCMHYGDEDEHTGVYVIATCSNTWNGPTQLRQKCEGPIDFEDPLNAAPVVGEFQGVVYRNRYCAECNRANFQNLMSFELKLPCGRLELSEAQILADLTYNQDLRIWGINRLNYFGNATEFIGCQILFDVPDYLKRNVRFCRSNIISTCPQNYRRQSIRRACDDYMAVVYDDVHAYKNPHCAICNSRAVDDLYCSNGFLFRKRERIMSFALLLDVNQSDGDQVGMRKAITPECPSGHKYDPFFKKCRLLVCALPGYSIVNDKCVRD